jgi:undecaprenyl-diphosphatase
MASGGAAVRSPVAARPHLHPAAVAAEVAVAGYVALAVFAIALGALLTHVLVHGWIGRFDRDVVHSLVEHRTPTWDTLSAIGSNLAGGITVPVVVFIILVVCGVTRHWTLFWLFAIATSLEGLTYLTATYFIVRSRPDVPRLETLIGSDSYFSGHTAAAVMLYGSVAVAVFALTQNRIARAVAITLAVVVPIAVACSRMYRGMHFPTDTLAGALVGLGCLTVAVVAVRRAARVS